jgi:Holliday junction resolvasome RuvABC DNA-binding subunit
MRELIEVSGNTEGYQIQVTQTSGTLSEAQAAEALAEIGFADDQIRSVFEQLNDPTAPVTKVELEMYPVPPSQVATAGSS